MRNRAVRSLPITEWPDADREQWTIACSPGARLRRGGRASHLKPITRADIARRYGYFLDFLKRSHRLDLNLPVGAQITAANVDSYVAELQVRVGSVTIYVHIHKLHYIARLIAPERDWSWLRQLESDLRLIMKPRSKYDRLVLAEVLVGAGLMLMAKADASTQLTKLARARQFRNGLMIAPLACCPIRLKNFATLTIGRSLIESSGDWWIVLDAAETKEGRPDERRVPDFLHAGIRRYLEEHRPVLASFSEPRNASSPGNTLWLSSRHGQAMTYATVEHTIIRTTEASVGIAVSPHLFRTSAATSSAIHAGESPHLASAVLSHRDTRVTQAHYNRASSLSAGKTYLEVVAKYRSGYAGPA